MTSDSDSVDTAAPSGFRYVLSGGATIRWNGGQVSLLNAATNTGVELPTVEVVGLLDAIATTPHSMEELQVVGEALGFEPEAVPDFVELLVDAGSIVRIVGSHEAWSEDESGIAVLHGGGRSLSDVASADEVRRQLSRAGVVLVQNVDSNAPQFAAFAQAVIGTLTGVTGAKAPGPGALLQLVDLGNDEIALHQENGRSFAWPDVIAFRCEKGAEAGGESILCDGVAVWHSLSEATRKLFDERRIRRLQTGVSGMLADYLEVLIGRSRTLSRPIVDLALDVGPDGNWRLYLYRDACVPTDDGLAFINSITGPYTGPAYEFEDGEPIPPAVIDEIEQVQADHTVEVMLAKGDLAFVDNNRWLHGRRAFSGQRIIQTAMGVSASYPRLDGAEL